MDCFSRSPKPSTPGLALLLLAGALLTGCTSLGVPGAEADPQTRAVTDQVISTGRSLLGQKPEARVKVNGRTFVLDCVGTVSAAWWGAGIDLQAQFARYRGNAVNRLYQTLADRGALYWKPTPSPGDLIFWDHTWDTSGDPLYADGHTHAGLVLSVAPDGTVEYLHESATRGVVVAYLNLFDPETSLTPSGRVLNSPMYLGSGFGKATNPPRWTSGQLWSAFADASSLVRNPL